MALRRRNANFELRRRVLCGPAQGKQSGRDPRERFPQAKRKFWAPETRFVWPCAGKTTAEMHFLWPCAGETQILTSGDAFFVALRRRNANFDLRRRIFCPDEVDSRGVRTGWTKSPRRYSETQKKFSARRFAQAKRKFWPPEWRFLWPCAVKNEGDKKRHLDLRGFTLTVRTPQCDTLFGEKLRELGSSQRAKRFAKQGSCCCSNLAKHGFAIWHGNGLDHDANPMLPKELSNPGQRTTSFFFGVTKNFLWEFTAHKTDSLVNY